jgi:hypothetical protein
LGSPCERDRFNNEGHVVSGGVQDVYQHLGTQGSPATCKTPKEPESVPVFSQLHSSCLYSKGTWSQKESKMSINILELKAVLLSVRHLKNQRVSVNSTVVACIRKQGGTHWLILWLIVCLLTLGSHSLRTVVFEIKSENAFSPQKAESS